MAKASIKRKERIIFQILPLQRFLISILLAVIVYVSIISVDLGAIVKVMIAWSVFALCQIITSWVVFFAQKPEQVRGHSRQEDGGRLYAFSLIIFSSFASLVAVLFLMLFQNPKHTPPAVFITVAIAGMLLSWLMVHTVFAFHYAYLYYSDDPKDTSKHAEGLEFPGKEKPDYRDFAYFSFVIGMTFQVSDVCVTSKSIRRLVLLHGLLSFGLNTFVVALTINLIAGQLK